MTKKLAVLPLFLLIIGFAGGYVLENPKLSFILYHIGGFGALGLLACVVGFISSRKGYRYWYALLSTLSISILVGLIAAYLVPPSGDESRPAACGGSVSLIVALILIFVWVFMKRRMNNSVKRLNEV